MATPNWVQQLTNLSAQDKLTNYSWKTRETVIPIREYDSSPTSCQTTALPRIGRENFTSTDDLRRDKGKYVAKQKKKKKKSQGNTNSAFSDVESIDAAERYYDAAKRKGSVPLPDIAISTAASHQDNRRRSEESKSSSRLSDAGLSVDSRHDLGSMVSIPLQSSSPDPRTRHYSEQTDSKEQRQRDRDAQSYTSVESRRQSLASHSYENINSPNSQAPRKHKKKERHKGHSRSSSVDSDAESRRYSKSELASNKSRPISKLDSYADLKRLSRAEPDDRRFSRADIDERRISRADVDERRLSRADVDDRRLSRADLDERRLSRADLDNVSRLTVESGIRDYKRDRRRHGRRSSELDSTDGSRLSTSTYLEEKRERKRASREAKLQYTHSVVTEESKDSTVSVSTDTKESKAPKQQKNRGTQSDVTDNSKSSNGGKIAQINEKKRQYPNEISRDIVLQIAEIHVNNSRRLCGPILLGLLLLTMAVSLGIAVYFALGQKDPGETRGEIAQAMLQFRIRNSTYQNIDQLTPQDFRDLAISYCTQMDQFYLTSNLSKEYRGCQVFSVRDGYINFTLFFFQTSMSEKSIISVIETKAKSNGGNGGKVVQIENLVVEINKQNIKIVYKKEKKTFSKITLKVTTPKMITSLRITTSATENPTVAEQVTRNGTTKNHMIDTTPRPTPVVTLANVCAGNPDGSFHPFPGNCTKFVQCAHGNQIISNCANISYFNPILNTCTLREAGKTCDELVGVATPTTTKVAASPEVKVPTTPYNVSQCGPDTPDAYYPHPDQCNKFLHCRNGTMELRSCQDDFVFDANAPGCVVPDANFICNPCAPDKNGVYFRHYKDCSKYYHCEFGKGRLTTCAGGLVFHPEYNNCGPRTSAANCPDDP